MKYRFSLILLFLLCFLSCSKKEQNKNVLKFWAMGTEGEYVQKLLPEFELENPEIKVKIQAIPWSAAQEKLITAFASDNLPDIFQLGNTWIPQFVALGALENLEQWKSKSNSIKADNYFSGIWNTNLILGKLFGIPWYIDTRVLFYRKDILAKVGYDSPPKNWDELYLVSKRIRELYGNDEKYALYVPTNEWANFVIFGLQAGASLLKNNNTSGNFSAKEFKRAFEYLVKFHKEKLTPLSVSRVPNVYQAFAEQFFCMYISGPWNINEFKKWMKGGLADKWMTAPLPGLDSRKTGVSLAGGSSLVIYTKSEKKKNAWNLIEYLSRPEIQLEFYKLLYDLPAVKSAWKDSAIINNPYMDAFYKQFQNVQATPKIPEWEQIAYSKLQQYFELAARGVLTTDEALAALDNDVNKILEKRRWLLENR